ncbi:hypothetical protein D3C73_1231720 [compost metagenome]
MPSLMTTSPSAGVAASAARQATTSPSTTKVKVEPSPGLEVTEMSPPMMLARRREIVSPSPVPPNRRVEDASSWVKGWNNCSMSAWEMPAPLSMTANSKVTRRSETRRPRVTKRTAP